MCWALILCRCVIVVCKGLLCVTRVTGVTGVTGEQFKHAACNLQLCEAPHAPKYCKNVIVKAMV